MMQGVCKQSWIVECQWLNKKPFHFGTVWTDKDAAAHEIEAEITKQFKLKLRDIIPDETPLPKVTNIMPGMFVFVEDHYPL